MSRVQADRLDDEIAFIGAVDFARYDVGLAGYNENQGGEFDRHALEAVTHLPGIESAAYSNSVPLSIDHSHTTIYPENTTDFRPANACSASYYRVRPAYFQTAGTRLLAGREFT